MHSSYILHKTPTQQRLMPSTVWRMHSIECGKKVFSVSSHSWTGKMTLGLFHNIHNYLLILALLENLCTAAVVIVYSTSI
jgi:hypothetical protein